MVVRHAGRQDRLAGERGCGAVEPWRRSAVRVWHRDRVPRVRRARQWHGTLPCRYQEPGGVTARGSGIETGAPGYRRGIGRGNGSPGCAGWSGVGDDPGGLGPASGVCGSEHHRLPGGEGFEAGDVDHAVVDEHHGPGVGSEEPEALLGVEPGDVPVAPARQIRTGGVQVIVTGGGVGIGRVPSERGGRSRHHRRAG